MANTELFLLNCQQCIPAKENSDIQLNIKKDLTIRGCQDRFTSCCLTLEVTEISGNAHCAVQQRGTWRTWPMDIKQLSQTVSKQNSHKRKSNGSEMSPTVSAPKIRIRQNFEWKGTFPILALLVTWIKVSQFGAQYSQPTVLGSVF